MGQRANLVISEASGYQLFYSHWCANTLTQDLFWGPEHAERFVRLQRQVDEDGWLDTIWAEGGAVIDLDRRNLLIYGGEDILSDVPLRRLYLQLLEAVWEGWTIQWAYEGIVDIAEYVGVPRSNVTADTGDRERRVKSLAPPRDRDCLGCIGSFERENEVRMYPLSALLEDYLAAGEQLLDACDGEVSYPVFDVGEWTKEFPTGGFHVNPVEKTLDFWIAKDCPNLTFVTQDMWPGWKVTWHKDNFESQVRLTAGALQFNPQPRTALLQRLRSMLSVDSKPFDMEGLVQRLAERDGGKIEVNPFAMRDDRLPVDQAIRNAVLEKAFSQIDAVEPNDGADK